MDDSFADASGRRLRTRGSEAVARSAALERLRAIRGGGARAAAPVQVKIEDPIYDTVPEEAYAALVARRRKDAGEFIIDDDGLGYVEDGREEDWTHCAFLSSSDEGSDGEDGASLKRKQPRPPQSKRPPHRSAAAVSLAAAATMMGKKRLSSMFTSSVFKKPGSEPAKGSSQAVDSIVDDVIAEFAPDENDRKERHRRVGRVTVPPPAPPIAHVKTVKVTVDGEMAVRLDNGFEHDGVSDHGNDMDVEQKTDVGLKPDVEMEPKLEATGCAELFGENKSPEEQKQVANGEVKIENPHLLNAKIKSEERRNDGMSSAAAGWMKICNEGKNAKGEDWLTVDGNTDVDESSEFELKDGALPFYILDACEFSSGTVALFAKVEIGKQFHSCCVHVKNIQRCIYAIPRSSVFPRDVITTLEKNSTASDASPSLRATLHELASDLKGEIADKLSDLSVSSFIMTPVKRNYAFEQTDLPNGEQYVLKINYPYKDTALPADLRGEHFHALLGTNNSALELFLVKRKIKGPSWLSISKFVTCPSTQHISWCKFAVTVACPKDISVLVTSTLLEVPPVVVAAINLKTIINERDNMHEIVSASVICCQKIDCPMRSEDWQKRGNLSHFTVLRKLEGSIFPIGLTKKVADRNHKAGSNVLALENSEQALLNRLMTELYNLDCDVLVGHNILGFDLDVLLHCAKACKVPSRTCSKIGRLIRPTIPKLAKGNTLFGPGASPGIMSYIAGRLLCDTYLCSRDLLRERHN